MSKIIQVIPAVTDLYAVHKEYSCASYGVYRAYYLAMDINGQVYPLVIDDSGYLRTYYFEHMVFDWDGYLWWKKHRADMPVHEYFNRFEKKQREKDIEFSKNIEWRTRKGEHMNEQLLTRLVESLEGINRSMADIAEKLEGIKNSVELLEKLSDCVYEPEPFVGDSMLCVRGMPVQSRNEKAGKMKIITQNRNEIVEYPRQVWVTPVSGNDTNNPNGCIMCNAFRYPALGEYKTIERAKEVLTEIFEAQRRGESSYYMPEK